MPSVLVTGGAGVLGSVVVRDLRQADADVRILSHRPSPTNRSPVEWAQADLRTGEGLADALAGIETVVHCHTNSNPINAAMDVDEVKTLLAAVRKAGVRHVVFISIVGIDSLGYFDYYRAKLQIEQMLASSGVPYSILRAAQFHEFVASILALFRRGPFLLLPPRVTLQPVTVDAVAQRLAAAALAPPAGRLPDVAGPEEHSLRYLARTWLRATNRHAVMLPLPLPIPAVRAMQQMTTGRAERIGESWDSWLVHYATEPNPYARVRS